MEFHTGAGTVYPAVHPLIRGYMQGNSNTSAGATTYTMERMGSIEVHIQAGNYIKLHSENTIQNRVGYSMSNYIRGHLISE